jgi:hypothetical protein
VFPLSIATRLFASTTNSRPSISMAVAGVTSASPQRPNVEIAVTVPGRIIIRILLLVGRARTWSRVPDGFHGDRRMAVRERQSSGSMLVDRSW